MYPELERTYTRAVETDRNPAPEFALRAEKGEAVQQETVKTADPRRSSGCYELRIDSAALAEHGGEEGAPGPASEERVRGMEGATSTIAPAGRVQHSPRSQSATAAIHGAVQSLHHSSCAEQREPLSINLPRRLPSTALAYCSHVPEWRSTRP